MDSNFQKEIFVKGGKTYLMRVGHEGADLAQRARAALVGVAVLAVDPRLSDDHASLALVDGGTDQETLRSGPGARVVNAKRGAELAVQGAEVEPGAGGDAVGDGPRLGDGDVDAVASGADDDRRHLHVPIDEPLLAGDTVGNVVGAGALVQDGVVAQGVGSGNGITGLDEVPVNLGGHLRHALELQEKLVGRLRDDGG